MSLDQIQEMEEVGSTAMRECFVRCIRLFSSFTSRGLLCVDLLALCWITVPKNRKDYTYPTERGGTGRVLRTWPCNENGLYPPLAIPSRSQQLFSTGVYQKPYIMQVRDVY